MVQPNLLLPIFAMEKTMETPKLAGISKLLYTGEIEVKGKLGE